MYRIDEFRELNKLENIVITQHGRKRFLERGILIADIRNTIETGEIIEQYEDDYPFPSCLILGKSAGKVIHIVASIDEKLIYIITAYIPSSEKWDNDWKHRKEES